MPGLAGYLPVYGCLPFTDTFPSSYRLLPPAGQAVRAEIPLRDAEQESIA